MVEGCTDVARTRHFRDLIAWQKAMQLTREVYLLTEEFPKSETFGLRMQLRRSAVSVASNITYSKRTLESANIADTVQNDYITRFQSNVTTAVDDCWLTG